MANQTETLSAAQQKAINWIHAKTAQDMGAIGQQIGLMLAELTVELADAKREATYWKEQFRTIRRKLQAIEAERGNGRDTTRQ